MFTIQNTVNIMLEYKTRGFIIINELKIKIKLKR